MSWTRCSGALDNPGGAKHLDLVFASGASDLAGFRVTLDDEPVASRLDTTAKLPPRWRAPDRTPGIDGDGSYGFMLFGETAPFGFQLELPPGKHRLAVTYSAFAMIRHVGDPTSIRQFAYVLAPAEEWKSFGGLDLTVHVPAGWRAATEPRLTREGDTLRGSFDALPTDAIALTIQAPSNGFGLVRIASLLVVGLVTIGGGIAVTRRRDARPSVLVALGRGVAWSCAFGAAGLFTVFGPDLTLAPSTASHHSYD